RANIRARINAKFIAQRHAALAEYSPVNMHTVGMPKDFHGGGALVVRSPDDHEIAVGQSRHRRAALTVTRELVHAKRRAYQHPGRLHDPTIDSFQAPILMQ